MSNSTGTVKTETQPSVQEGPGSIDTEASRMATIGQVEPFDESQSDWETYEERINAFLRVNKIPDANKVDAFFEYRGSENVQVVEEFDRPKHAG